MSNALDILGALGAQFSPKRRLVFVCGDMAELGEQSENCHTELGVAIAHAGVRLLLAVGQFAEVTATAARKAAAGTLQTLCFKDTFSVCSSLHGLIEDDDIVLVKGSRLAQLELAVNRLKELYAPAKPVHAIEEVSPPAARTAAAAGDRPSPAQANGRAR